jgi:thiamine pyridinylase
MPTRGLARKGALGAAYQPPPPPPSDETTLNVALYRYVPSLEAFEGAVQAIWESWGTGYELNWAFYDCYAEPPPPTLDVFAFDCIYVDDLVAAGQIDPIATEEVADPDDLLEFALNAAAVYPADGALAGIPYLGCTAILYYRNDDPAFQDAESLSIEALHGILGNSTSEEPEPPLGEGLLIDLGGKTTDACNYAALWRTQHESWWPHPIPMTGALDPFVVSELRAFADMAGRPQALFEDPGEIRTDWFAAGRGRAIVGLTETMSAWSPQVISELGFCPLPCAASAATRGAMCYADAVGIRPKLGDKREAALRLANLIASPLIGTAAIAVGGHNAQYLIPARASVLDALGSNPQLPAYARIKQLLDVDYEPAAFRLGQGVRAWAPATGKSIIAELFGAAAPAELAAARLPRRHRFEHSPAGLWRRER